MTSVKFTKAVTAEGTPYKVGDIADLPDGTVQSLLHRGWAVEAKDEEPKPKPPPAKPTKAPKAKPKTSTRSDK